VVSTNDAGVIIGANELATKLFGYKYVEMEGKGLQLIYSKEVAEGLLATFKESEPSAVLGKRKTQSIRLKDGCLMNVNMVLATDERNNHLRFLFVFR
jgi:PAS domain S-box-containing protein